MRRALMVVGCVAVALFVAAGAFGKVRPKPWQWAPAKIEKRLVAAATADCTAVFSCLEAGAVGRASCKGTSRPVAGRYSVFRCRAYLEGPNITPDTIFFDVLVRIRPVGSGVFCIVSTADGKAAPHVDGSVGISVAEGRRC